MAVRQCSNAQKVAEFLAKHEHVTEVQRNMTKSGGSFYRDGIITISHRLHVWNIYLHLGRFLGQMLVNIPYMDPMGIVL